MKIRLYWFGWIFLSVSILGLSFSSGYQQPMANLGFPNFVLPLPHFTGYWAYKQHYSKRHTFPWWSTHSRSSKGWTSTMYDLTRLVTRRNLNHWYPFVFIFMWKCRHDLRPCSSRLRSHLSQLGSLGDTHVHLMQSDWSPPTPRPLGANPRNTRPHNITLAITKNGIGFNGLSLP